MWQELGGRSADWECKSGSLVGKVSWISADELSNARKEKLLNYSTPQALWMTFWSRATTSTHSHNNQSLPTFCKTPSQVSTPSWIQKSARFLYQNNEKKKLILDLSKAVTGAGRGAQKMYQSFFHIKSVGETWGVMGWAGRDSWQHSRTTKKKFHVTQHVGAGWEGGEGEGEKIWLREQICQIIF